MKRPNPIQFTKIELYALQFEKTKNNKFTKRISLTVPGPAEPALPKLKITNLGDIDELIAFLNEAKQQIQNVFYSIETDGCCYGEDCYCDKEAWLQLWGDIEIELDEKTLKAYNSANRKKEKYQIELDKYNQYMEEQKLAREKKLYLDLKKKYG